MSPDISWSQNNFSSGEWSPPFRGRLDDKGYDAALSLCLNYIPNQEQSLTPRSGLKRAGITYFNQPCRLIPFRLSSYEPYVAEFTAEDPRYHFGNLQFWANGLPVLMSDPYAILISVTGSSPPVFTFQDNRAGGGNGLNADHWFDGDSVFLVIYTAAGLQTDGYLVNREFTLNVVSASAGTATFTDAETGAPLVGSVSLTSNQLRMYKRLQIQTWFNTTDEIRKVEFASQAKIRYAPDDGDDYRTQPDHRVAFMHPDVCPQYISSVSGIEAGLYQADFLDGPYLDSSGTDIPVTVSGVTGTITITLWKYSATAIYQNESLTWDGTKYYVSLANDNLNNALPTYPASTPKWASLPIAWSGATTYFLGQTAAIFTGPLPIGTPTVYYSLQAGNINHQPPNLTWWDTTPAAWDIAATYSDGAVASYSGLNYTSLVGANVGNQPDVAPTFWLPVDIEAAIDTIYNTQTGWPSRASFSFLDEPGHDDVDTSPGRLIRLKWGYQPWVPTHSYAANDFTLYKDNIYKALQTALAKIPDQEPTYWEIQTKTIFWTWAQVTHWTDKYTVTALIRGDDLPSSNTIWEFRLGLYCDALGYPKAATYHEGRLWFSGSTPNRIDGGVSNEGFNFSPTATDGTVADNNAISYTLNSKGNEDIHAIASVAEGIILATSEREWLVSASSLSDPLTPTSIQAHPTTSFSAAKVDIEYAPNAVLIVQNGRRRLMEHRTFIEQQSYQSRLNAVDLTRRCQHLTGDGLMQVQYQSVPQPVIWALPRILASNDPGLTCIVYPNNIITTYDPPTGTLFGMGYARTPDVSYEAPFSFEHGRTLYDGVKQDICSIAVNRGPLDTAEYLYIATCGEDNLYHVEMLMPAFDSSPLDDTFNDDGTVNQFGTLASAFYLDSALMPYGCKIAADGLSCTFYGLHGLAGETVQFTCRGKWVGEYTISASGTAVVTFNTQFAKTDIGLAMKRDAYNATTLPAIINRPLGRTGVPTGGQTFLLDLNGNTGVLNPGSAASADVFYGQFGYAYRRRGKTLRPSAPGRNGPAFAKVRRNERAGVYIDAGQEVSLGDSWETLYPLDLTIPRTDGKIGTAAPGYTDFVTGIYRDEVNSDHTFDGEIFWEQTRPVPGAILSIGGFEMLTDS